MARPHRIVPGPGRPTRFRQDLADALLRGIAGGRPSGEVCQELGLPRQTVAEWRGAHPEFRDAYLRAFASRCCGFAEEAIEIVDSIPEDADMARVQRDRTRADFRKWVASRLVPALHDVQPALVGAATVVINLPAKGGGNDGARVIDGQAVELLENGKS